MSWLCKGRQEERGQNAGLTEANVTQNPQLYYWKATEQKKKKTKLRIHNKLNMQAGWQKEHSEIWKRRKRGKNRAYMHRGVIMEQETRGRHSWERLRLTRQRGCKTEHTDIRQEPSK